MLGIASFCREQHNWIVVVHSLQLFLYFHIAQREIELELWAISSKGPWFYLWSFYHPCLNYNPKSLSFNAITYELRFNTWIFEWYKQFQPWYSFWDISDIIKLYNDETYFINITFISIIYFMRLYMSAWLCLYVCLEVEGQLSWVSSFPLS